jgi:DNA-directed RNA polymerase specialized sigma24 family protein
MPWAMLDLPRRDVRKKNWPSRRFSGHIYLAVMGNGASNPHRNTPESPWLPSSPANQSEAEIIAALEALSDTDIRHLVGFARYRILGLRGAADEAEADDLFSEAVMQTLKLKRKWKRGISFRNHLIACMRSIASSRFKRASRNVQLSPDQPDHFPALILILDAETKVHRLRGQLELAKDATAQQVLATLFDGLSPKQAQELLHMRPEVYQAARKRIRRLADKLFGAPKDTGEALVKSRPHPNVSEYERWNNLCAALAEDALVEETPPASPDDVDRIRKRIAHLIESHRQRD